jgi:Flp pilus assembly protein TadD
MLLVVTAPVAAHAQSGDGSDRLPRNPAIGSIEGRVVLPSGRSVGNPVKVTLSNNSTPLVTVYTNESGQFRFGDLPLGIYYISIAADEKIYEPFSQEVNMGNVPSTSVTLFLREKGKKESGRPGPGVVSAGEFDSKAPSSAKKEYEKAAGMIEKGDTQNAVQHLARAITIYPDYLLARNELGVQYLKLKRYVEAAEQFESVISKDPKHFNARFNLGLVRIEERNYKDAVSELTEATSIDSSSAGAHMWLGVALLQIGELSGAERDLKRTLQLGGTQYSIAHYYLAHLYMRKGEREMARTELKAYLTESPSGDQAAEARALLAKLQ